VRYDIFDAPFFQSAIPDAQIDGHVGRRTSFEVVVNNTEIHSKLKTMAFPNFDEVVKICQNVSQGGEATTVTKTQSNCVII
jgi:selenoprotein W-related protein